MTAFPYHMRNGRDITERHPNADVATVTRYFNLPRRQVFPDYSKAPAHVERGRVADALALARAKRLAKKHGIGLERRGDHFYIAAEQCGRVHDPIKGAHSREHGREVLEAVELVLSYLQTHQKTTP